MYNFTKFNEKDSGYAAYTLRSLYSYEKMEEIMDKIHRAKNGRIMNIEENFHTHTHTHRYIYRSRESAVGIATGYGLDDRGVGFRVPVG
jgi:hypothetical protein